MKRLTAVLLASAAGLGAGSVAEADAATTGTRLAGSGSGITAPTGIARTADGALWISDAIQGTCRMSLGGLPHPVASEFCGADHIGPSAGMTLAGDPVTGSLYVADRQSNSGAVWRLDRDPLTGDIDGAARVARLGADRATAVALVPTGAGAPSDVVFATKNSTAIQRVTNSSSTAEAPVVIGHAADVASTSLAVLGGKVYIGSEAAPVGRMPLTGGAATPVLGMPESATALTADVDRNRIYAGTVDGSLDDRVVVYDATSGVTAPYARGYAAVTAVSVDADGSLLVADDPGEATGAIDTEDQGRLWSVPLQPVSRPTVRITAAPGSMTNRTGVTFAFAKTVADTLECRLDGAAWAACDTGSAGYGDLTDGTHTFDVRATDSATGAVVTARRVFGVDTRAPLVTLVSNPDVAVGDRPDVELVADEDGVSFSCSYDDGPAQDCSGRFRLPSLTVGRHVLRVVATDAAGNVAETAEWWLKVAAPVAPVTPVEVGPVPAPAPATPTPTPTSATATGAVLGQTATQKATGRVVVSRATPKGLKVVVRARGNETRALITLRDAAQRIVAFRTARLNPGATTRLSLRFTRTELRRLKAGTYRLSITPTGERGQRGAGLTPISLEVLRA